MSDTSNKDETVNAGDTSNNGTNNGTSNGNAVDPAEVERLRKEAEQKELRIRQLENEAKARADKEAQEEAERLAKQGEYKTLLEQEAAKRKALEDQIAEDRKKSDLAEARNTVSKDFSAETIKEAEELGIELTDASDDAVASYKAKLDKLQAKSATKPVTPNNGNHTAPTGQSREELLTSYITDNRESTFDAALNTIPALNKMRADNGDTQQ